MITERVHFRLIKTECCGTLLCWVNPRFPNYCPECGTRVYPEVKGMALVTDINAVLKYEAGSSGMSGVLARIPG